MRHARTHARSRGAISGPGLAIGLGVVGGLILLALTQLDLGLGFERVDRSGQVSISINGIAPRIARDVLLPPAGWVLQIEFPDHAEAEARSGLSVQLRAERSGAAIQIEDRFNFQDGLATFLIPESLGLSAGLFTVRANLVDASGNQFEASRRMRIRTYLGGPPIGSRQVIHFDFSVDRDADGLADFARDLERFGLASPDHPELARIIAERIEVRALERVERAYDATDDPNRTGQSRDLVRVYFRPTEDPAALTTRICVGGSDPTESALVGHVRFDRRNKDKTSVECAGEEIAGLFPAELEIYKDSPLYREILKPFLPSLGGTPIGGDPTDSSATKAPATGDGSGNVSRRAANIERAIDVFGSALGSIMAHEAGHALGLVAEGKPGVGLFGGSEDEGEGYAHNLDTFGEWPSESWLMNPGPSLSFEALAGEAESGPLRFRPLNYAYLRDRIVVSDKR